MKLNITNLLMLLNSKWRHAEQKHTSRVPVSPRVTPSSTSLERGASAYSGMSMFDLVRGQKGQQQLLSTF